MSIQVSSQAMRAMETVQQVTANNIANMNTPGFSPSRADLETGQNGQSVRVSSVRQSERTPPATPTDTPEQLAPSATDLTTETVNMIATQQAYNANATMLRTQAATEGKLINEMV